jgi:hypothetical protein
VCVHVLLRETVARIKPCGSCWLRAGDASFALTQAHELIKAEKLEKMYVLLCRLDAHALLSGGDHGADQLSAAIYGTVLL